MASGWDADFDQNEGSTGAQSRAASLLDRGIRSVANEPHRYAADDAGLCGAGTDSR